MTEQNFNKAMATAADIVVAETEQIVPVGEIEPENIHTPCYVDDLVQATLSVEYLGYIRICKKPQQERYAK